MCVNAVWDLCPNSIACFASIRRKLLAQATRDELRKREILMPSQSTTDGRATLSGEFPASVAVPTVLLQRLVIEDHGKCHLRVGKTSPVPTLNTISPAQRRSSAHSSFYRDVVADDVVRDVGKVIEIILRLTLTSFHPLTSRTALRHRWSTA